MGWEKVRTWERDGNQVTTTIFGNYWYEDVAEWFSFLFKISICILFSVVTLLAFLFLVPVAWLIYKLTGWPTIFDNRMVMEEEDIKFTARPV